MNKRKVLCVTALFLSFLFILTVAFHQDKKTTTQDINQENNSQNKEEPIDEKTELEKAQEEYDVRLADLNSMNLSKMEWFRQYKLLVEEYKDILGQPTTIYDKFTQSELDLLFKVVQAEIGRGYSFEQKCNVVSVIYNRLADPRFGNTIDKILVAHQFSVIGNGAINKVTIEEKTILACEYVYLFGDTTDGALFFDSNGKLKYAFLFNDGAHNFYTKRK